ncbi:hypothetical protein N7539_001372 [Penicillium diatomitis]|uniref:protein-serine/threonine phosphatase n=1 Tax=Penicillium diatomitis TaxID=2819901 RepID=A0A9X0BZU3_9EURO|nr:uncharacterized protein N7539_001372 [Penicillium diatomitis]KAJ5492626.1 hypothetical protein N7539_001372 [Penicillium diatomitis]
MSSSDALLLFDVGASQAQGSRKFQEDRYTTILPEHFPVNTNENLAFFAVYDGHGSDAVAEHASQHLHHLLAQRTELPRGDYAIAIKAALADEDALLLERFQHESVEPAMSGSTVAMCLINLTEGELVVSNLGDSHVVMAERDPRTGAPFHIVRIVPSWWWSPGPKTIMLTFMGGCHLQRRLTEAHKPDTPSEQARIKEAGGIVEKRNGVSRLGSLNMSRALGDLQYKNPVNSLGEEHTMPRVRRASSSSTPQRGNFVSNEPYTSRRILHAHRRYLLVIVSDGVSDYIDDTVLIQYVMDLSLRGMQATEVAHDVVSRMACRPRSDNASCVIVMLNGQES